MVLRSFTSVDGIDRQREQRTYRETDRRNDGRTRERDGETDVQKGGQMNRYVIETKSGWVTSYNLILSGYHRVQIQGHIRHIVVLISATLQQKTAPMTGGKCQNIGQLDQKVHYKHWQIFHQKNILSVSVRNNSKKIRKSTLVMFYWRKI